MTTTELTRPAAAELVPTTGTQWHPVDLYLYTRLGRPSSRTTQLQKLHRVAALLTGGRHDAYTYPWQQLDRVGVQALQAGLAGRYSPAYTRAVMSAVRGVCRQSVVLGLVSRGDYADTWADLPPVRGSRLPPGRMVPVPDLQLLLVTAAADSLPARGGRDAAAVALLFGAGVRRAEAVGLVVQDLDLGTGTGWVTVRAGKGNNDRRLPLLPGLAAPLVWWLQQLPADGPVLRPVYRNGRLGQRALSVHSLGPLLARLCDRAGVPPFACHDARRTFASLVLACGGDLTTVSRLMGHSSPTVTARYDHRGDDALQQAVLLVPALTWPTA